MSWPLQERVCSAWKWALSLRKSSWQFEDYLIAIQKIEIDEEEDEEEEDFEDHFEDEREHAAEALHAGDEAPGRVERLNSRSAIFIAEVCGTELSSMGTTRAQAVSHLREEFRSAVRAGQVLPRPGAGWYVPPNPKALFEALVEALKDRFIREDLVDTHAVLVGNWLHKIISPHMVSGPEFFSERSPLADWQPASGQMPLAARFERELGIDLSPFKNPTLGDVIRLVLARELDRTATPQRRD